MPVNDLFNEFLSTFSNIVNKHALLKLLSHSEQKRKHKPWITKGLLKSVKHKNKLYKIMLKENTPENAQLYKKYRKKLTRIKELAKKNYYEELVGKNSHDSDLLWKTKNDFVKFKRKSSSTQILTTNGIMNSPAEISKAFNDHFTSIANSLAADIPDASNQLPMIAIPLSQSLTYLSHSF